MPTSVAAWVLAAELDRLRAKVESIRELVAKCHALDPEWRRLCPRLEIRFPPPLPAPAVASPHVPHLPRRQRRHDPCRWTLADEAVILDRLKALSEQKERKAITERMLERLALSCVRTLPRATRRQADAVEQLAQRFPNFENVSHWVRDQIALCAELRMPLRLPPVLLLGPPGIGKTMFCIELAATLGALTCVRSLADTTASWLLTGGSTKWANGGPGAIAQHLSDCPENLLPWFIFDEIDKAAGDRQYSVGPSLLGLLEPVTAQRFRDEALEIELDIRPAGFIFTANELDRVRPELVSRLKVIEVRPPTTFEMPAVIASVDAQMRKEHPQLGKVFAPIDATVQLHLQAIPPRELRRVLMAGYARAVRRPAASRGRRRLQVQDLPSIAPSTDEPNSRVLH
jgi:hypothetical protein